MTYSFWNSGHVYSTVTELVTTHTNAETVQGLASVITTGIALFQEAAPCDAFPCAMPLMHVDADWGSPQEVVNVL